MNEFKSKTISTFLVLTHCPEICPTTLSELSNVVDNLKNKIKLTNIIFVTVDPKEIRKNI